MYEVIQIFVKIFLTAGIISVTAWITFNPIVGIWKADIDVRKLLNLRYYLEKATEEKPSWLPARDNSAVYQNGHIVGKIYKEKFSSGEKIEFEYIYEAEKLNPGEIFEYKNYILKIENHEGIRGRVTIMVVGGAGSGDLLGPAYGKVIAKIVGMRKL